MNYVISDIHGHYAKYKQILERIHFQDEDTLYVLGDVIDRGPDGIKILQDMMMRPNVIPILGNHEYMATLCISWLLKEVTEENVGSIDSEFLRGLSEWMSVGGEETIAEFRRLSQEEREDIMEYLYEFGLYEIVEAGGKTFVLVHAGMDNFSQERDLEDYELSELLFNKPQYDKVYYKNKYLVTGHTPTRVIYAAEQGRDLVKLEPSEYVDKVYEKNNHIAIDCGCEFGGKLACVCLDTLEKFYV